MPAINRPPCPHVLVTTSPEKGHRKIREWIHRANLEPNGPVRVVRGSMRENSANVSVALVADHLGGTARGRQEIEGEFNFEEDAMLFSADWFVRQPKAPERYDLKRVVIGVDPAITTARYSDLTGIVAVGTDLTGTNAFVLEDRSGKYSPEQWAREVLTMYRKWGASQVVIEMNRDPETCRRVLRQVSTSLVINEVKASSGKAIRAEPVAALYEQRRVIHCGDLRELEAECLAFDPNETGKKASPDRLDAMVWAVTELLVRRPKPQNDPGSGNLPQKFTFKRTKF